MSTALDTRYGRTRSRRTRGRIAAVVVGAIVIATALVWVVWVGLGPGTNLQSRDLGYANLTTTSVDVKYEVTADPGTAVSCALQAQNKDFAVVGWKIVALPPSTARTRSLTQTLTTSEPAVTGLIYRCWLT